MSRVPAPWLIAVGLVVLTGAAYSRLGRNDFIDLDDGRYVTDNPWVKGGLTLRNIAWAWAPSEAGYAGYYQPLTWMSLQLDASLFSQDASSPQLNAAGFHLHNLFWHAATTVLLFFVLRHLTGATGCSAVCAALFAVHPLHVESVAWATERKDVLSTFFWVLTLGAYARYVATRQPSWYTAVLLSFALGLLAKPMLVTLPCVLLLLDFWPLQRVRWRARDVSPSIPCPPSQADALPPAAEPAALYSPLALFVEKLPLFALAAVASIVTVWAQRSASAVVAVEHLDLLDRLANAVSGYGWYLEKTFWPAGLAVFYPHEEDRWTWSPVLWGGFALLAGTLIALAACRRVPALLVGWLWFLGTLVPVIGLVQVGSQAMADRFCYVPHIGLFLALVWGAAALLDVLRVPTPAQLGAAGALVLALAGLTFIQVGYWQNTGTIWAHALDVTEHNHRAHANLGKLLVNQARFADARRHYEDAVAVRPKIPDYQYNLGVILMLQGEYELAIDHFQEALRSRKDYQDAAHNLGVACWRLGQLDRAAQTFRRVLEDHADAANTRACLGAVLWLQGQRQSAAAAFEQALTLAPTDSEALNGLGLVRLHQRRESEAADLFGAALHFNPSFIKAYSHLGLALGRMGRWQDAARNHDQAARLEAERHAFMTHPGLADVALYRRRLAFALAMLGREDLAALNYAEALRLDPSWPRADTDAAWHLATAADPQERNVPAALELAGMACRAVAHPPAESLDALAAAYAAAGRYDDARSTARRAIAAAKPELARQIEARLRLYELSKTFVQPG